MKTTLFAISLSCMTLAGCSSLPSQTVISQLPVVTFGEPVPQGQEFILHFPAGKPIGTNVTIEGNLFDKPAKEQMFVKPNKDIYAYKNWVSFDRTKWNIGKDILSVQAKIKIPGPTHPELGIIYLKVDEKK